MRRPELEKYQTPLMIGSHDCCAVLTLILCLIQTESVFTFLASREFFPQNSVFYWGPFHAEKVPQIIAVQFLGKLFETLTKVQLEPFHVLIQIEYCSFHPLRVRLK